MSTSWRAIILTAGLSLLATSCDKAPQPFAKAKGTQEIGPTASAATIASALGAGNYEAAALDARAALHSDPANPEILLLLARAEARLQNVGDAVKALQASFDGGFHDPRGAINNPDFDDIRSTPLFRDLARRYDRNPVARAAAPPSSSIQAGDVSIVEDRAGHSRVHAGNVTIEE